MNKTLRILFLDDDKQRIKHFLEKTEKIKYIEVDISINSKQAIKNLNTYSYDVICLDHDLGGQSFVDSSEDNTGYKVAEHISSLSEYNDKLIFIHSWNPVGADNIYRVLSKSLKIPFGNNFIELLLDYCKTIYYS